MLYVHRLLGILYVVAVGFNCCVYLLVASIAVCSCCFPDADVHDDDGGDNDDGNNDCDSDVDDDDVDDDDGDCDSDVLCRDWRVSQILYSFDMITTTAWGKTLVPASFAYLIPGLRQQNLRGHR